MESVGGIFSDWLEVERGRVVLDWYSSSSRSPGEEVLCGVVFGGFVAGGSVAGGSVASDVGGSVGFFVGGSVGGAGTVVTIGVSPPPSSSLSGAARTNAPPRANKKTNIRVQSFTR